MIGATQPAKRRRPDRRGRPRSRTFAKGTRLEQHLGIERGAPIEYDLDALRPQTRDECRAGLRPCPWAGCRHHLYLDVNPETGSIKINFPDIELEELAETCSLDVAERGVITLEEVARVTNLTRERVRQIETKALFATNAAPTIIELRSI